MVETAAVPGAARSRSAGAHALPWFPAAALVFAAIWLLTHPYLGLLHDSILYTLQALAVNEPALRTDLFLAYGSQSGFTIFPTIHAAIIQAVGLETANLGLALLGHCLWICGLALFARRLARGLVAWATMALIAVLPSVYGGFSLLSYAEGFLTARIFAEAITLAAIALMLARRWRLAFLLQGLVLAIHPLIAVSGLGVLYVFLLLGDRRWLYPGLAGVAILVAAAAAGLDVPARLFQAMDTEWFAAVKERNQMVFVSQWETRDWHAIAAAAMTLGMAVMAFAGWRRRFFGAVLIVALACIALSFIAGDIFASTLVVQLQLWRANWLMMVASVAAAALLLVRVRKGYKNGRPISALILVALIDPVFAPAATVSAGVALIMVWGEKRGGLPRLTAPFRWICFAWAGLCLLLEAVLFAYGAMLQLEILLPAGLLVPSRLMANGLAGLLLALSLCVLWHRMPRMHPALSYGVAIGLLWVALAGWDQRTPWLASAEARTAIPSFDASLPAGAQVFWHSHPMPTWTLLGTPNYVSRRQGAGLLFSHATAEEFERRVEAMRPIVDLRINPVGADLPACGELSRAPAPSALAQACASASNLDFMILPWPVRGLTAEEWHSPAGPARVCRRHDGFALFEPRTFYLFSCQTVLDQARQAAAAPF